MLSHHGCPENRPWPLIAALDVLVHRRFSNAAGRARATAVYAMGILAVFWCLDRTVAWLG